MRLATKRINNDETLCVVLPDGYLPLKDVNRLFGTHFPNDLTGFLVRDGIRKMNGSRFFGIHEKKKAVSDHTIPERNTIPAPLYRNPGKIWGIGLNYKKHAEDLSEKVPDEGPASFMKPFTTIIGEGDTIEIPTQSDRTTAEAELAIIIGKKCKHIEAGDWLDVVAGFTNIIDMTAEDILRKNPRYLTRSKSFDTFLSIGPEMITPDEIPDPFELVVETVHNGTVRAKNAVSAMTFPPDFLVSFHSKIMTLLPGDIILTGTPGAVPIADGDIVESRITGFPDLVNPVRDLKRKS